MRVRAFMTRNIKELLRDPLNLAFGIGFPIVLILLLSLIQSRIPVSLFEIEALTPGITIFGLSFMTLFSATIISKDRSSAFFQRLYTTPLRAEEFIMGYALPIIPLSLCQSVICYLVAFLLGLTPTTNVLFAILFIIPISIFYVSLGLLCGSVFNDKQVGGICGSILTNLSAWLSGAWFDIKLVGGVFEKIANVLPFVHAVELEKAVLNGAYDNIFPHLWWVLGYAIVTLTLAITVFLKQMKK